METKIEKIHLPDGPLGELLLYLVRPVNDVQAQMVELEKRLKSRLDGFLKEQEEIKTSLMHLGAALDKLIIDEANKKQAEQMSNASSTDPLDSLCTKLDRMSERLNEIELDLIGGEQT